MGWNELVLQIQNFKESEPTVFYIISGILLLIILKILFFKGRRKESTNIVNPFELEVFKRKNNK